MAEKICMKGGLAMPASPPSFGRFAPKAFANWTSMHIAMLHEREADDESGRCRRDACDDAPGRLEHSPACFVSYDHAAIAREKGSREIARCRLVGNDGNQPRKRTGLLWRIRSVLMQLPRYPLDRPRIFRGNRGIRAGRAIRRHVPIVGVRGRLPKVRM